MRRLWAAFRKAVTVVLPWPPRSERQAAIADAARGKERAQAEAEHAREVERQLRQMTQNGYARDIARQIMRGHRP